VTPAADAVPVPGARGGAGAWAFPALLALLPALLLLPAVGPGRTVFGLDFVSVFYFTRSYVTSELRAGRLPLWDPHALCGFPLLAALQAAVLYPPAWLQLVLPEDAFWTFVTWLHLAGAALLADAWLRRGLGLGRTAAFAGAVTFSLSGYLFTRLYAGHVGYVWAYPWGAFALWRLERWLLAPTVPRAALVAPALPLMVLAGVPQLAFALALLLTGRLAHFVVSGDGSRRERARRAAGASLALAAGVLLAAPQLLPTLELIPHVQRLSVADSSFVTSFSLPPENLVTFLAPTVFGDAVTDRYWGRWHLWEVCGYVGVVGLLLALLGCRARHRQASFLAAAAVLALLLALGRHTPLFELFRAHVAGAGLFRGPGRYLYVFTLAASGLVALGVERIASDAPAARRAAWRAAWGALVLAALLGVTALALERAGSGSPAWQAVLEHARSAREEWSASSGVAPLPVHEPALQASSLAGAVRAMRGAAAWAGAAGGILVLWLTGLVRRRATSAVLVALLVTELAAFDARYVRAQETAALAWPRDTVEVLRRRAGLDFRLTNVRRVDAADAGRARLAGLAHAGGYEPMLLQRYADLVNTLDGRPLDRPVVLATLARPHPISAMLGARVWLAPHASLLPDLRPLSTIGDAGEALEWREALPRAFVVPRSLVRPDRNERLGVLARPGWDPRATVVLENPRLEDEDFGGRPGTGSATIVARAPGSYEVEADAPSGGFLVLAEAWFPGWQAEVDGTPVEVLRANHLVQAVRLEPGRHRVRFAYRSRRLAAGLLVAGVPLVLLAASALVVRRRSKRGGRPRVAPA
jgi:hypothetical protein